jgi:hypothetical protein
MPKKTKAKGEISLMFPYVPDEKQEQLVGFLEANGFEIRNVKVRESRGEIEISCTRSAPICLCCLAPLQDTDIKDNNGLMCRYCGAGDCEIEASHRKFETGHGHLQKTMHTPVEEEEEEEVVDDDADLDEEDEDAEDDVDGDDAD